MQGPGQPVERGIPPAEYCPVSIGAQLLADRWTLLIIHELLGDAAGFNELRRRIPGLNRSILISRLRHLERLGVLERKIVTPGPRRHVYRLTEAGRAFAPVVWAVAEWTSSWRLPPQSRVHGGPDSELEQAAQRDEHSTDPAASGDEGAPPEPPLPLRGAIARSDSQER